MRKNPSGRLPNPATPSLQMPLPADPTSVILRKCHLTISVQSRSLPVPTIPLPRASALAHATACSPSLSRSRAAAASPCREGEGPPMERREAEGPPRRPSLDVVVHTRAIVLASPRSAEYPKATHIYTVSITYFVLKFYERFFKTRSIIHVIGTNIYIYIRTCVYRIIWRCSGTYS